MKPFAPASIGLAKSGAAYFMISNGSGTPDKLRSAQTDIARKTEIHNHLMQDGVMKRRKVDNLEIKIVDDEGNDLNGAVSFSMMVSRILLKN